MLDMVNGEIKPDNEVVFYDGFLIILYVNGDKWDVAHKILNGEYDEPVTLADIAEKYPTVHKVIFDDATKGYVYNYGNHRLETYKDGSKSEMWELVGTTLGYA